MKFQVVINAIIDKSKHIQKGCRKLLKFRDVSIALKFFYIIKNSNTKFYIVKKIYNYWKRQHFRRESAVCQKCLFPWIFQSTYEACLDWSYKSYFESFLHPFIYFQCCSKLCVFIEKKFFMKLKVLFNWHRNINLKNFYFWK